MKPPPTLEDLFAVLSAAAFGQTTARVPLPDEPQLDDVPTRLGVALNLLLDELGERAAERERLAARVKVLADASREFSLATENLDDLLNVVAQRLGQLVGDMCGIRPVTEDGQWIESRGAVYHRDPALLAASRELMLTTTQRVGEGLSGRVAATGQPVLTPRIDLPAFIAAAEPKYRPYLERLAVTSSMVIPLICRGKVVGVANLMRGDPARPYDDEDLRFVQSVADHAALAIGNARSYAAERAARAAAESATQELQDSEARYRLMFDNSPLPNFVFDLETLRVLAVNDAAVREYGHSREEFLQLEVTALRPAEDLPEMLALLRSPNPPQGGVWRHRRKSGATFNAESTSHTFTLGGRACRLAVVKDVSERMRLEDQLRQSQKMEAVGKLAGGVAHDFNNVLSVILSYAELLLGDLSPSEPMHADVEQIRSAGARAAELTRQLLMFSRQQVLEPRVLDLNEVLSNMDKMLQRILGADVDLVSQPAQPLGRVRVDPNSIEQVIMNLVVNARDAMPRGGQLLMETANVILDEAFARDHLGVRPGPHVMLAVTDTGTGMDKDTLTRLFEPFFTTKPVGKGTGLGLSTVFGIVSQSGGTVWVYSEVGKGTTFKVYLPRVDDPLEVVAPPAPPVVVGGSETILLVEDHDQLRIVARGILARAGYHVMEARNAGEALLCSEKHEGTIHLLLTDVVMPQMSGPELAQRLAPARPDMKVLCMSGYTDDSIVRHGVLAAHIAFLQKPITPETLTTKVRDVLTGRRLT